MFRGHMQSIDAELLITLIKNRPVLWDKFLEFYRDKNLRTAAWSEVCNIINENFEDMDELNRQEYAKIVVKKWNQLRDSWIRSIAERNDAKKSKNIRKYIYHKQMLFLKKVVQPNTIDTSTNEETYNELDREVTVIQAREQTMLEQNESPRQDNSDYSVKRNKRGNALQQNFNARDQKKSFIDHQMQNQKQDRHLYFVKSLLPSLALLNDDEVLEFQAGVIALIQKIKSHNHEGSSQQPSTSNCLFQPALCSKTQNPVQPSKQIQTSEKNITQPIQAPIKRSRVKSSQDLDDFEIDNNHETPSTEADPLTGIQIKIECDENRSEDEAPVKLEPEEAENSMNEELSDDSTNSDSDGNVNEGKTTISASKKKNSSTAKISERKRKHT